ncbi:hydroxypyruvate isomerase family protein [soil metagenome]
MPRFAANVSTMYTEHAFERRFDAAVADGFEAVECQFPYEIQAPVLARCLADAGCQQVLINAPPGNWREGERGIACLPGRESEFRASIARALDYATALDCPRIHVMAGVMAPSLEREAMRAAYLDNLAWAAQQAHAAGRDILIEPINGRDMPGYFLSRQDEAHAIVAEIGASNLGVQMDLYHCQIVEGDLEVKLRRWLPTGQVVHLQIASVPGRHEPDEGEVCFPHLFGVIDELDYPGWVGCEYRPRAGTSDGLGWLNR